MAVLGPSDEEWPIHDDPHDPEPPSTDRMTEEIFVRKRQIVVTKVWWKTSEPAIDRLVIKGYQLGRRRDGA
jgi:hypothetical protein